MLRPCRAVSVIVQPLKLIVRRPLAMPHRRVCCIRFGFLITFFMLQSCAVPGARTPAQVASTEGRQQLLVSLKQCLKQVASANDHGAVSSCVHLDVAILNGIAIAQLKSNLGPSGISSDDYVVVPGTPSATPQPYEGRWAFYRLTKFVSGGGPELQCVSDDKLTCSQVRWVQTL
jgi:hypothetical protein